VRKALLVAIPLLGLGVSIGLGGPIDGPTWKTERVGAKGRKELVRTFAAGERACVIAIGDHKPVVELTLTVYDEKDEVVAQDRGTGEAGDFVAAIWYPPREASYRIVIDSPGVEYNDVAVSIK
jgi:hypothetical protein